MSAPATAAAAPPSPEVSLDGSKCILFYDGVCVMCNDGVRVYSEADTRDVLRFAPLQSRFAHEVLARHGHNASDMDSMYLLFGYGTPQERVVWKFEAVTSTMSLLPGALGWVGRLLKLVPLSLGNRYYERRARTRYAEFGKYDACPVPPPEVRRRLLALE
ncbi:thiol-disulfide oxidoreductase DCC family protein [Archangium primigenium]|uniref:thiol-disulfide oxidoreductase DCC family protein n=1 Tax=[Archangium] primigenium TaxID=2792470 RepID=UPI0019567100|nr:DCC1-like thiol-disulfide oxidoreductase family protein [Archangium primigenium]MBM7118840.1 DUF393 domain-containing protein [Archangium primigenium]